MAVINILMTYDLINCLYIPKKAGWDILECLKIAKRYQDALHFVLDWAFNYCDVISTPRFAKRTLTFMQPVWLDIFQQAISYSSVFDCMNLLYRDLMKANILNQDIVLEYDNESQSDGDVANLILGRPDAPEHVAVFMQEKAQDLSWFPQVCGLRLENKNVIKYQITSGAFNRLRNIYSGRLQHLWTLPEGWSFGEYTYGQFKILWLALLTVDRCLKARVSSGKGFSHIQSISIEAVVLARSI